jgi:hypothetical protein
VTDHCATLLLYTVSDSAFSAMSGITLLLFVNSDKVPGVGRSWPSANPIGIDDMTDLIRRFAAWLGLPAEHRRARSHEVRESRRVFFSPPSKCAPLPAHRSPYGLNITLDGTATVAVRPYLVAHEQREQRRERSVSAMGLGMPGPYWIHGVEVA